MSQVTPPPQKGSINEIHGQFCDKCTVIFTFEEKDVLLILSLYKGSLSIYVDRCEVITGYPPLVMPEEICIINYLIINLATGMRQDVIFSLHNIRTGN